MIGLRVSRGQKEEKKDTFYRTEREYGSFYRAVPLPEGVKLGDVKATFADGVLEVTVPLRGGNRRLLELPAPVGPQDPARHADSLVLEPLERLDDPRGYTARFIADQDAGAPDFRRRRAEAEAHPIEETGRKLRGLMSWVSASDDYTGTAARS